MFLFVPILGSWHKSYHLMRSILILKKRKKQGKKEGIKKEGSEMGKKRRAREREISQ